MNYKRVHDSIIERGKLRGLPKRRPKGFERHHVIPRSLGGTNERSNLVDLTPREHFVVHWLLTKLYDDFASKTKMIHAFVWMTGQGKGRLNSKSYQLLQEMQSTIFSESLSGDKNPFYGKKHSLETRQKISEAAKKQTSVPDWKEKNFLRVKGNTWNRGRKHSDEVRQNMKLAALNRPPITEETRKKHSENMKGNQRALGMVHTAETKQRISENLSGEKNPFFGKTHSENSRLKISEANKKAQQRKSPEERSFLAKRREARIRQKEGRSRPDDWKFLQ